MTTRTSTLNLGRTGSLQILPYESPFISWSGRPSSQPVSQTNQPTNQPSSQPASQPTCQLTIHPTTATTYPPPLPPLPLASSRTSLRSLLRDPLVRGGGCLLIPRAVDSFSMNTMPWQIISNMKMGNQRVLQPSLKLNSLIAALKPTRDSRWISLCQINRERWSER